jgi:hypothetical protein
MDEIGTAETEDADVELVLIGAWTDGLIPGEFF